MKNVLIFLLMFCFYQVKSQDTKRSKKVQKNSTIKNIDSSIKEKKAISKDTLPDWKYLVKVFWYDESSREAIWLSQEDEISSDMISALKKDKFSQTSVKPSKLAIDILFGRIKKVF